MSQGWSKDIWGSVHACSFSVVPMCLLSSLIQLHVDPLLLIPYNFSRSGSRVTSFFPPLFLFPSLPSLPSFLFLLSFIKLPKQGKGMWTSIYWRSLFARNLTCIISLNPWNNAEWLDWLFSYFYYFEEEETEPKWCWIPWPRSHGWCWQIYI